MLQNLTDDEIDALLDIGYLHHADGRQIDKEAVENRHGRIIGSCYEFHPALFGESASTYWKLSDLLLCEYLSFDDLRREWMYHGTLLSNAKFCEQIVHEQGCPCMKCIPNGYK